MVEGSLPKHLRLFIAIAVPHELKLQINSTQAQLQQNLTRALVKWTRPEQLHLTLRFLGNVDTHSAEQLINSVHGVCRSFRALDLCAHGIGFFPSPRAPRVLWVGVQDQKDLLRSLQAAVQQATQSFTREKGEEHFSGHITLARIKNIRRDEIQALNRSAEPFAGHLFGQWTANEVLILRSELSSQGAEHSVVARASLC